MFGGHSTNVIIQQIARVSLERQIAERADGKRRPYHFCVTRQHQHAALHSQPRTAGTCLRDVFCY